MRTIQRYNLTQKKAIISKLKSNNGRLRLRSSEETKNETKKNVRVSKRESRNQFKTSEFDSVGNGEGIRNSNS